MVLHIVQHYGEIGWLAPQYHTSFKDDKVGADMAPRVRKIIKGICVNREVFRRGGFLHTMLDCDT